MATQVGSLYTSLTLESSSFVSNMKRAATATEQGAAQINKAFSAAKVASVGFLAAISVDQLLGVAKRSLDYASSLGEISQQLGIGTKAYQEYSYAATQTGIDQSTLEAGLAKLTRTLGEAKSGGRAQVEAFKAIGISYDEVRRLSPDEVFRRVAEGLSKIPDPAVRAAREVDLFGKAGQKLDPLLAGGAKGIDELRNAAERLGVVLSDEAIAKADDAADKFGAISKVLSANIAGVVADNSSAIFILADSLVKLAGAAGRGVGLVADYFRGLGEISKQTDGSVIGGLTRFTAVTNLAGTARFGKKVGQFASMTGLGNLRANGLPGFDKAASPSLSSSVAEPAAAKAAAAKTAKTTDDIYKGLTASAVRNGGLEKLSDVLGRDGTISTGLQQSIDKAADFSSLLKGVAVTAVSIEPIKAIDLKLVEQADKFSESLATGLGQAIIYGQSLGDALVNAIKAAAAELIASKLLSLLKGGSNGGFIGTIVSGLGAVFGGGKAGGGSVKGGYSYDVGELGRERVVIPANGQIIPNKMLNGAGGMVINVDARGSTDPAAVRNQVNLGILQAAPTLVAAARGNTIQNLRRPKLPGGGRA